MRINPINSNIPIQKYRGNRKAGAAADGFSLQGTDSVVLSGEAKAYAQAVKDIRASLTEVSSEDALRLRNLAKGIQSGAYHVDTESIVDKMIQGV